MSTYSRLTEVFSKAEEIPFDDSSKIILMSDCHRGDCSWADNFANNWMLFFNAHEHYFKNGFTYIELGDGDELWENKEFSDIKRAHSNIFWLLSKYYRENRLYMLWGNHDMEKKYPRYVKRNLYTYFDESTNKLSPLFEDIKIHEGLILRHSNTGNKLFLVHGHQGDTTNDTFWKFERLLCRYIWRNLELIGVNDPTSPAINNKKRNSLEKRIIEWAQINKQVIITGHLHRPAFPDDGEVAYFNAGSCVHPRCITGIEINQGQISLIKWSIKTRQDGSLYVGKEIIAGPKRIDDISW